MVKRRGNREGSIYHRESDGLWVGAVTLDDGKRRVVYGRTQRDARERLRELQRKTEDGLPIATGRVTVESYMRQWCDVTLRQRLSAGRLKPSTFDSYRDLVERHIVPALGATDLRKLTASQVRSWLTAKLEEEGARGQPLSRRTVAYIHAVLRKALADAVREELVARNVAALVEPPVVPRHPVQPLAPDEAAKLLAAAAEDRLGALWLTILSLGLRRGEALALCWDDLDLENRTVTVRGTLQRLRGDKDANTGRRKGALTVVSPKTQASGATIALPLSLVGVLEKHERAQRRERLAAPAWADPSLVFTTKLGTPLEPRNVNRAWAALCDRADVRRIRIHDLRHAAATFMFSAGVDLKIIQRTLRHSRLSTTADVYAHVLEDVQRQAANGMDEVLERLAGSAS